jgi:hypothetical protein
MAGRVDILAALKAKGERQGERLEVFDVVAHRDLRLAKIKGAEHNASREAREIADADRDYWQAHDACLAVAEATIKAEWQPKFEEVEAARRQRAGERRELRDVVDLAHLRSSSDPAEIVRMIADADDIGGELVADQARSAAVTRLQQLAAAESKQNKIGGPCFAALCAVSHSRRPAARADIAARLAERLRATRQFAAEVAAAAGLPGRVAPRPLAPVPELGEGERRPGMVMGAFWDAHPELESR